MTPTPRTARRSPGAALAAALPATGLPAVLPTVERPPLVRAHEGRMIGGVAAGLAVHLGWPVRTVRIALVGLTIGSGMGVLLYAWLWALVPSGEIVPAGPDAALPGAPVGSRIAPKRPVRRGHLGDLGFGALLLLAGAALVGSRFGWAPAPQVVLPLLVMLGGAVIAYTQLDQVERSRWMERTGVGGTRSAILRVAAGLVIVLIGVLLVAVQGTDAATAWRTVLAVLAVLGGTVLVLAPWGVRLWRDLDAERSARVRQEERADIAAHLHDSVLQTLALIQRHSGDGAQVARLARAQERDLRDWLYGPRPSAEVTVATAVRAAAADVEDRHGVAVDLVVVGDGPAGERVAALVAALREAMVNAVRHAGAPVSVYVEVGPDEVEAFVRDRGPGFDPGTVPSDRLGVRESIIGRMERHGGTARVRSDDGEGTEVMLRLPIEPDQKQTEQKQAEQKQAEQKQTEQSQTEQEQGVRS